MARLQTVPKSHTRPPDTRRTAKSFSCLSELPAPFQPLPLKARSMPTPSSADSQFPRRLFACVPQSRQFFLSEVDRAAEFRQQLSSAAAAPYHLHDCPAQMSAHFLRTRPAPSPQTCSCAPNPKLPPFRSRDSLKIPPACKPSAPSRPADSSPQLKSRSANISQSARSPLSPRHNSLAANRRGSFRACAEIPPSSPQCRCLPSDGSRPLPWKFQSRLNRNA